jgi:hypothetical protein
VVSSGRSTRLPFFNLAPARTSDQLNAAATPAARPKINAMLRAGGDFVVATLRLAGSFDNLGVNLAHAIIAQLRELR